MSFNDIEVMIPMKSSNTDDRDYKELIQRISQQLFHINGNISQIEKLVGLLGSQKDTNEIRTTLHDITMATQDQIKDTTHEFKMLPSYHSKQSKQRRLEQQKLTKDFQTILTHFQNIQKTSLQKQREYVDKNNALILEERTHDTDGVTQQVQQQQVEYDIEYHEMLVSERQAEIENIEHGISELNEVFRDMSMLVNEQESGIQSIYGNIIQISEHTRQAGEELVMASHYQRRSGRSICCFLLIIVIVGILLALIIA